MGSFLDTGELERQIHEAEVQVSEAESELALRKRKLVALVAIRNNARMLDIDMSTPLSSKKFVEHSAAIERGKEFARNFMLNGQISEGRKNLPSTEMVAELVSSEPDILWSREAIHSGFERRFGIPETWANPSNALNNAIARAVAKGLIDEADGYYSAAEDSSRGGPVG